MNSEQISFHLKPLIAAIKSYYSVFAIEIPEKNEDEVAHLVERACTLIEKMHASVILNEVDLSCVDFRGHLLSPSNGEQDYFVLAPHIKTGYSPFLINYDGKEAKGVLTLVRRVRSTYCSKTISKICEEQFLKAIKEDSPLPLKTIRAELMDNIRTNGNTFNVPLVETISDTYIYLDKVNNCILCKGNKSSFVAMKMFLSYLSRLPKDLDSAINTTFTRDFEDVMSALWFTIPYTNYLMGEGKAFGAYNVATVVRYYSDADSDTCPVEATETGRFKSAEKGDQSISFNNSLSILVEKEAGESDFSSLQVFSQNKDLELMTIRVSTEMDNTPQLNQFIEEHPEEVGDDLSTVSNTLYYDTKAIDGNVSYKIASGMDWHIRAVKTLIAHHAQENHIPLKGAEQTLHNYFSGLLPLLQESTNSFVTLYLQANKVTSEFGNELSDTFEKR